MNEAAILLRGAGKRFRRYHGDRAYTLQEWVARGLRGLRPEIRWALREVDLQVFAGEMVGVVGRNGAGKTTLLRVVAAVLPPDEGQVQIRGRMGALIDLGAGYHPELTGRENLWINGVIAGLTRQEVAHRLDQIVAFAELEDFIDSPLRMYSAGMQLRLAFSVAVHTDPQVLLVDEVLAVGDLAFQRKCLERIGQIKQDGCAILLVSHDIGLVERMCDRAICLEAGRISKEGLAAAVTEAYVESAA